MPFDCKSGNRGVKVIAHEGELMPDTGMECRPFRRMHAHL